MAASISVSSAITSKLSTASFLRNSEKRPNRKKPNKTDDGADEGGSHFIEGKHSTDSEFSCTPYIVEFRRLLQRPKYSNVEIIPGVSNRELLHATIALFDNCLPDITSEVLYSTICEKWATTLLLVRNCADVAKDYRADKTRNGEPLSSFTDQAIKKLTGIDLFSLEYHQINGDLVNPVTRTRPSGDARDINCNSEKLVGSPNKSPCDESARRTGDNSAVEATRDHAAPVESRLYTEDVSGDLVVTDLETRQGHNAEVQVPEGIDKLEQMCRPNSNGGVGCQCLKEKEEVRTSPEGEVADDDRGGEDGLCVLEGSEEKAKDNRRGKFAEVFSDTESEGSSSSEEEENEDFSEGADIFLKLVEERRVRRQEALEMGCDVIPFIGIESRLVGCATWEKSHVCPGEATIQIDLLAVRRRYRKFGVGKYLLERMKDPSVVGRYDALIVYADHSAVKFFAGHGFSDDIVLNSKYSELADNWTNCTLMTYIPPFTGQSKSIQAEESLDLRLMELEIQKWTLKSREAYQAQMGCLMRMRHEIIALKALVSSQKDEISSLSGKIGQLQAEKQELEKKNLLQRIIALKSGIDLDARLDEEPDTGYHEWDECDGGEEGATLDSSSIINDLEKRLHDLGTESDVDGDEELIDWTVAEEFTLAMKGDPPNKTNLSVLRTKKAHPTEHTSSLHVDWCRKLNDPAMKTKMYFSGSLTHPERISTILANGFSSLDFTSGEFGRGLYFSQHPSTAAHFSALGKVILAEVAIGRAETITQEDRTRTAPSRGYDSIITKGRLRTDDQMSSDVRSRQQEYVIFHPSQALPLYLIEYRFDV